MKTSQRGARNGAPRWHRRKGNNMWLLTRDNSNGLIDGLISLELGVVIRPYALGTSYWSAQVDGAATPQKLLAYRWPSREEAMAGIKAIVGNVIDVPPGADIPSDVFV